MSATSSQNQAALESLPFFHDLPETVRARLLARMTPVRFALGHVFYQAGNCAQNWYLLSEGKVRLLGESSPHSAPIQLDLLAAPQSFGWPGVLLRCSQETAIAATDGACVILPADAFQQEAAIRDFLLGQCPPGELFAVLENHFRRQAFDAGQLRPTFRRILPQVQARQSPDPELLEKSPELLWLIAGSRAETGRCWSGNGTAERLIGFPENLLPARETPLPAPEPESNLPPPNLPYPDCRAQGGIDSALACFEMLCAHLGTPFRREVLRRVFSNQGERSALPTLRQCGAVAELAALDAQLIQMPRGKVNALEPPALLLWQENLVVLYETGRDWCVFGNPASGLCRLPTAEFTACLDESPEILLIRKSSRPAQEKFGLRWFLPAIRKHRRALIEVFIASLFVQLFALANPIITQVIIDKVLVQNSLQTLHVLGLLLIVVAVAGTVLTGLRTFLFVDTTNRIDFSLGGEIINHLYRLTLPYFQRRPVGEIASRLSELENVRQFLTGTALTVVLDGLFSVVYVAIMLFYNVPLTIVALITLPLLAGMTLAVAPIYRRQLRARAVTNAHTQSHLVETLTGIQTVKAQNLEQRSRWEWQRRYAHFVTQGFNTVLTSTTVGSATTLLGRLSDLAVLWYGASLVIAGSLTLGQLIAFRIIAGYVTNPLLRLVQSWQNFQEVALSIERLGDVVNSAPEQSEEESRNIPMVPIEGRVRFDGVSFAYLAGHPPQVQNFTCDLPPGSIVGIVGASGSGKSTVMKLLPRLYLPDAGRILIDEYDISKVELYSLRRQIGMVLQDSLLFDATVEENIAAASTRVTPEQIVEAAKIACAHDFIMALPAGYNTRIGEQGRALSGGQRQRVAIARAILQRPRLLILDEATSALDYPTERQVFLNLTHEFRGRTVLFVTHRLRSVAHADMILVLDRGLLVEKGNHSELLAHRGLYHTLYQQQEEGQP